MATDIETFNDKVESFKRKLLRDKLDKCTIEQQNFFDRLYKSIDKIPSNKMARAYQQVCATLEKNNLNLPDPVEKE